MNNIDYIKFVVAKVESGFLEYSNSREYVKVITVLNSLKMADDILKELYILSGIKKLRRLTSYLIFMLKKVEAGSITLDNFMENYVTDRNYIDSYFQTFYDLELIAPEEFIPEEIDTKFIIEDSEEPEEAPVYLLAETTFKVEELDNELVTEEFRESTINENYESPGDGYMKLADDLAENSIPEFDSNEVFFDDRNEDVFNFPVTGSNNNSDIIQNTIEDNENLSGDTLFTDTDETPAELPVGPIPEEQTGLFESLKENTEENNENLADFFEKLDSEETGEETLEDNTVFIETPFVDSEKETEDREDGFADFTDNIPESKILKDLIPVNEPDIKQETPSNDIAAETDKEVEEKLLAIEKETTEEVLNSEFLKYEKGLYEKNRLISGLLDDLILISESKDPDLEMRDAILQEIYPLIERLKEESEKLSFEIISGIYDSMKFCLDIKFKELVVTKENIEVLKLSLAGIENLIKGDELKGFDKTIKELENIQNELNKLLADREDFEKKKYDFGEEESNLIKEFKDSSEYDAYIILREKITELEDTFQIIAGMKDKTYPFESLRKLSVTFALFREIVNIARVLEMNKVAHLAEAGYVFVKFVQNYRIDPFKDEVTEVFKYLIYSFKLIYLDKPVKDFDTFLSFLNDPVKIFYQKPKTNE